MLTGLTERARETRRTGAKKSGVGRRLGGVVAANRRVGKGRAGDIEVGHVGSAGESGHCESVGGHVGSAEVGDRCNGREGGVESAERDVGNVEGDGGHGEVERAKRQVDSAGDGEVSASVKCDGADSDGADGDRWQIGNGVVAGGNGVVDGWNGEAGCRNVVSDVEEAEARSVQAG